MYSFMTLFGEFINFVWGKLYFGEKLLFGEKYWRGEEADNRRHFLNEKNPCHHNKGLKKRFEN